MTTLDHNLSTKPITYTLPDLFSVCTLEVLDNPNYEIVGVESRDWVNSLDFFSTKKRASFTLGRLSSYKTSHIIICH
jgi:hypothetical protein